MIAVALRGLRHRPGNFVATFLSAFLGATLLMTFAAMLDTAADADPVSAESLSTTAMVAGGWCLIIVIFAVTSTLSLAVRRRAEQTALLRRLGATGPQVGRMIVGEAAAVALLASAVAVPVAQVLGRLLLTLMQDTGQVATAVGYAFGPVALGVGFGVTLLPPRRQHPWTKPQPTWPPELQMKTQPPEPRWPRAHQPPPGTPRQRAKHQPPRTRQLRASHQRPAKWQLRAKHQRPAKWQLRAKHQRPWKPQLRAKHRQPETRRPGTSQQTFETPHPGTNRQPA
ncbi:FtsX-like permease family protein [Actinoplanes sp. NPDC048791]|uniref:FtsX-like permease family protein n=1 Tax=Actinoplanes sp. NPDC048791 TaxID=3154623 RepID=UPI0033D65A43